MRERNWRQYNRELVQRGSLTFLIDPKLLKSCRLKPKKKQIGRPIEFSDHLILILMMIKTHYRLAYRPLEGFAKDVLCRLYTWMASPTYSLICKRTRGLEKVLPRLSGRRPHTIIIDASGMKTVGEGEWKVKVHGRGAPRKWIKMHIGLDPKTQEIVSEMTTLSGCGDATMVGPLLDKSGKQVKVVVADGAYDRKKCRNTIKEKGSKGLIPPPKNGKFQGDGGERDEALFLIKCLGGDKQARSIWGKLTGYNRRVLVETAFSRFKRYYGDRVFSKVFEKQRFEISLKWYLLNRMRQAKV